MSEWDPEDGPGYIPTEEGGSADPNAIYRDVDIARQETDIPTDVRLCMGSNQRPNETGFDRDRATSHPTTRMHQTSLAGTRWQCPICDRVWMPAVGFCPGETL